jgi:hypothetical protein
VQCNRREKAAAAEMTAVAVNAAMVVALIVCMQGKQRAEARKQLQL